MKSVDEVVENVRLGLFISGKIVQYGLGAGYYTIRNPIIMAAGLITGKGSHEDTITGSPHHILRCGLECFVSGGKQVKSVLPKAECKKRCDYCPADNYKDF